MNAHTERMKSQAAKLSTTELHELYQRLPTYARPNEHKLTLRQRIVSAELARRGERTPDPRELELVRLERLLAANLAKRWDPETPPRSRFAYAAHATKLDMRIRQLRRAMERGE
jgi:hypothetical protein